MARIEATLLSSPGTVLTLWTSVRGARREEMKQEILDAIHRAAAETEKDVAHEVEAQQEAALVAERQLRATVEAKLEEQRCRLGTCH